MILTSITKPCSREKNKDSRNEKLITSSVFKLLVFFSFILKWLLQFKTICIKFDCKSFLKSILKHFWIKKRKFFEAHYVQQTTNDILCIGAKYQVIIKLIFIILIWSVLLRWMKYVSVQVRKFKKCKF